MLGNEALTAPAAAHSGPLFVINTITFCCRCPQYITVQKKEHTRSLFINNWWRFDPPKSKGSPGTCLQTTRQIISLASHAPIPTTLTIWAYQRVSLICLSVRTHNGFFFLLSSEIHYQSDQLYNVLSASSSPSNFFQIKNIPLINLVLTFSFMNENPSNSLQIE